MEGAPQPVGMWASLGQQIAVLKRRRVVKKRLESEERTFPVVWPENEEELGGRKAPLWLCSFCSVPSHCRLNSFLEREDIALSQH